MKASLALSIVLLSTGMFSQTIHNQGGHYQDSPYSYPSFFSVDSIDGQSVTNSWYEIKYHAITFYLSSGPISCFGVPTDSPAIKPYVGFQFTRTYTLSCSDGSQGTSVQKSDVWSVRPCGGRIYRPCPYEESQGGVTTLTK
jgi:hypothetical protein